MIAVIRIRGQVGLDRKVVDTFDRLRLRKKYSCVVIENPKKEQLGMIKKLRNFVAYGEINDETYKKLVDARGGKTKNFFRLHPPRKGFGRKGTKKTFSAGGALGYRGEKINDLIKRMI